MSGTNDQDPTQGTQPSSAAGVGSSPPGQPGASPAASTEVTRPEYIPEQFWDSATKAPKLEDLSRSYADLAAFKANEDSRRAAAPEKPDGYKLPTALPESVKLPDGMEWKFDETDPRLAMGRQIAHEMGLDQVGFETKLLKPFIEFEATRAKAENERITAMTRAQDEVLGPKAGERRDAVKSWIAANAGAESLGTIEHMLPVAGFVTAMERIMRRMSGGGTPFTGTGRDGGADTHEIEGREHMSAAEKMHAVRLKREASAGAARR